MHGPNLHRAPVAVILEGAPAQTLEIRLGLDLGPAHGVQGLIGELDHVKLIEAALRMGQIARGAGLEGARQLHGHRLDGAGIAAVGRQVGREDLGDRRVPTRRAEQHAARLGVVEQADIAQPADVFFVHADARDVRIRFLHPRCLHHRSQYPPQPALAHAQQPRYLGHRHRLRQGHCEGLEQQGKPAVRARPRHRYLGGLAAASASHPRYRRVQIRQILEEVQVLPGALPPVMERLLGRPTGRTGQARRSTTHVEMNLVGLGRKPDVHPATDTPAPTPP